MGAMRDFFLKVVPKAWAEDMEADSRKWIIRCNACGFEESIWDIGGIRWKATRNTKATVRRCKNCGKFGGHTISYREA